MNGFVGEDPTRRIPGRDGNVPSEAVRLKECEPREDHTPMKLRTCSRVPVS
jgi:hypothetical protein